MNIMKAAMVYRILSAAKATNGVSGRLYYKICRILSESGILFAVSSLLSMITLILDANPYGSNIPRKIFHSIVCYVHLVFSSGANAWRAECFYGRYCIQPYNYPRRKR